MLKNVLGNFKLEEVKLYEKYSLQLGNIFESNWGYDAMHSGTLPID